MSNEKSLAMVPKTIDDIQRLSEMLSKSALLPDALKGKTADIAAQVLAGAELGLPPMASIRGVHVVQGKPILSADTMVALAFGSGLCEYFLVIDENATSVTYETKRKGSPQPQRFTWSEEDTKRAGLNTKDNHRTHPRQMRRARAKAILARDVYPDVLAGCYDPDEFASTPFESPRPIAPVAPTTSVRDNSDAVDAEIVSEEDSTLVAIDGAATIEDLKALVPNIKKLSNGRLDEARARYNARLSQLEQGTAA